MTRRLLQGALATSGLLATAAFAQPPTDVGTLPGFTIARPKSIDNHRDIVGQVAREGPDEQAALWTKTHDGYSVEALPPFNNLVGSDARAFGRQGTPVGYSYGPGGYRAVVWREDPSGQRVAVDLEPPAGFTDALAFAANPRGFVVGEATNPWETVNGSTVRHAVVWVPRKNSDYEVLDLGVPEGYDVSSASGINELGEVVGTARRLESDGAGGSFVRSTVVVWRPRARAHGRFHADTLVLPPRADLPRNLSPTINTVGLVVAQADRATSGQPRVSRPLLWKRWGHKFVGPYELPVPEGFTDAAANDVNELGTILGTAYVRPPPSAPAVVSQAVVWTWSWKRARYVPDLLPNPPGATVVNAACLNERGDAVGSTPQPPPGTSGGLLWKRKPRGRWFGPHRVQAPDPAGRSLDYRPGSSAEGP